MNVRKQKPNEPQKNKFFLMLSFIIQTESEIMQFLQSLSNQLLIYRTLDYGSKIEMLVMLHTWIDGSSRWNLILYGGKLSRDFNITSIEGVCCLSVADYAFENYAVFCLHSVYAEYQLGIRTLLCCTCSHFEECPFCEVSIFKNLHNSTKQFYNRHTAG